MDKRNTLIGVLLLVLGFGLMFYNGSKQVEAQRAEDLRRAANPAPKASETTPATAPVISTPAGGAEPPAGLTPQIAASEELQTLANDFIKVTFTTRGGAIKQVDLLKHADSLGSEKRYTFRAAAGFPMLGLAYPTIGGKTLEFAPAYRLESKSATEVVFSYEAGEDVKLVRTYRIDADPKSATPYSISHSTRFENAGTKERTFQKILLNVGTAPLKWWPIPDTIT